MKRPLLLLMFSLIYYSFAELGLGYSHTLNGITPIWPPSGFALAISLIFGFRYFAAIPIGLLLIGVFHQIPWPILALGIFAQSLEFSIGRSLFLKFKDKNYDYFDIKNYLRFLFIAALPATFISALVGSIGPLFTQNISSQEFLNALFLWWFGNFLGASLFTPVFYEIIKNKNKLSTLINFNFLSTSIAIILIMPLIFGLFEILTFNPLLLFLPTPLLLYSTFKFKKIGYAIHVLLFFFIMSLFAYKEHQLFNLNLDMMNFLATMFSVVSLFNLLFIVASAQEETHNKNREIQELQSQLTHDHKLATLGVLSSSICHEINNPLAVIHGNLNILKKDYKKLISEDHLLQRFDKIEKHIFRLSKIINGLKNFSKESSQLSAENESAEKMILDTKDICQFILKDHNVFFSFIVDPADLTVYCNPVQIVQVLTNLVKNASEAISKSETRWIKVKAFLDEHNYVFSVMDSGNGINPNDFKDMQKPFFTTKSESEGLGLGLQISKQIIEQHSGSLLINYESKNTEFIVKIPLAKNTLKRVS